MSEYFNILDKYIPSASVDRILGYLADYSIHLNISRTRNSKLGDFKPPVYSGVKKISVNHNLNPYSFLITLVHEIAHVHVWDHYGVKVKPHGSEWKTAFRELLTPFLVNDIFPDDIMLALRKYLWNPKASTASDVNLARSLGKYDNTMYIVLEDLPVNAVFRLNNGRVFKKLEKRRTRYRCLCLDDNKYYTVNPLVKAEELIKKENNQQ